MTTKFKRCLIMAIILMLLVAVIVSYLIGDGDISTANFMWLMVGAFMGTISTTYIFLMVGDIG